MLRIAIAHAINRFLIGPSLGSETLAASSSPNHSQQGFHSFEMQAFAVIADSCGRALMHAQTS